MEAAQAIGLRDRIGRLGIAHVAPSRASSLVARRSAGQYRLSLSSSGRRSKSQAG